MFLKEFFGKSKQIHLKPDKNKDENQMNNELFWFILDHDRLHKDYFYPLRKKLKANQNDKSILDDIMEMVKKGCKEFYAHNKMEGKLGKLFPEELRKDVCQKLYDHYKENLKKLMEGGNLTADPDKGWIGDPEAGAAQQINLQVTNRSVIVPILNDLLASINSAYQAQYKQPLWDPKLLKSQKFLSGSSLHFFNVKGIPDKVFVEKKPKVGDIDTMVDKEKETDLESFLTNNINKTIGPGKLRGFQRGNEQFSSLWELQDPPIKIQIDLEYVKFDSDEPTPWSRFSHSSDWNDIQAGVKGVFHKYLIQSFAVLSKIDFILRKQTGRGKNKTWQDVPTSDAMFSFAVSSKEGGGLRAKYTPVLNPTTNEPEMQDGLPVMLALPASGYEQDIGKMFQSLFGVKMNPKAAEQLADKFWSFTGLLEVMNKLLEPEEKSRVLGSFLNKTFGAGAQGLYKNDPQRDSAEKMAAIELLMKTTGAKPPEGMDLEQMRQEYVQAYKVTAEALDEADDINAAPKPSFARQGIPHLYNRLPDGRVSSTEMKDSAFVELCKEIAGNGGTLDGFPVTLKVDGKGVRFGKDESGRAFFMTDKISQPLYKDNVGYFTNFAKEKGQDEANVARAQGYDDILNAVVNSRFIETIPPDTIITAELLYNPMAEKTKDGLKFIKIAYDPKKLGKTMTIAPIFAKQFSTGETKPDQDKILSRLASASDSNIKIVSNKLEQKGINVSKIIDPVVNMDQGLVSSLSAKGTSPEKTQAKQIIDQAKQALSDAIITSPKLKGIDSLGPNNEGIVVNMPSGGMFKVTSGQMKSIMAKQNVERAMGSTKPRTAVVAIGNFAGHRGHEDLINYAIKKAQALNGTPFVYVGAKVGADDPIDVDTKIQTLQKLLPGVNISPVENQVSASGEVTAGNHMKKIEYELVKKEPYYNNIVITVGSDQADSMASWASGLEKRFAKFPPLSHVKISVDSLARGSAQGGSDWSTTALRNSLKTKPEDQAFQDWSKAYNVDKLGADWIKHLMDVARKNMGITKPQQQPQPVAERLFTALVRPRLVENDPAVRAVQQMLNRKGANLDIDGVMGPLTKKSIAKYLPKAATGLAPEPNKNTAVQGKDVKERMMPASNFAGTPKNKLGPAAHLKGKMKRPARAGDLVGDAQEGYYPKDDQFSSHGRMPRIDRIPQDSTAAQAQQQAMVDRMKQRTIDTILDIKPEWGRSDLELMTAAELNQILRDLQFGGVSEAVPFSYGFVKPPRKGSVAYWAAKKRKEQEKGKPPIEPKDQMVGVAKVTKDVAEGVEEGWKSKLAGLGLAAAAGMAPGKSDARVNVDDPDSYRAPAPIAQQQKIDYTKPGPVSKDSTGQKLEYGIPVTPDGKFKAPSQDLPDDEYAQQLKAYKTWKADFMSRWPDAVWNSDGSAKSNHKPGLAPMTPGYKPGSGQGLAPVFPGAVKENKFVPLSEDVSKLYGNYLGRILLREISGK